MDHSLALFVWFMAVSQASMVESQDQNTVTTTSLNGTKCPPWFFYNSTIGLCQCFESLNADVRCTDEGALLRFGRCMTYQKETGVTTVSSCSYFVVDQFIDNVTQGLFIRLPNNVLDLNDYLCLPLNRKGENQCSECFEGYGISLTSLGYQCSNCDGVWYGIPLYLLLEFAPITIFYILILVYRPNVTKAPMTSYIMFSQLTFYSFILSAQTRSVYRSQLLNKQMFDTVNTILAFYGIWNLDFFRYVLPPFCVSSRLKLIHVFLIDYIAVAYPICLIIITWIWIELTSRGFKPLVWISKNTHRCCVGVQLNLEKMRTVIDVFASFLVLAYSKLLLQSLTIIAPNTIRRANFTGDISDTTSSLDLSVNYFSSEHLPIAIFSIIISIVFVVLPILVLALYPFKAFRKMLRKLRLLGHREAAFHLFVERFYSCYRDGLDGGKDMRSFASLYFFLRFILVIFHQSSLELVGLSGPGVDDAEVVSLFLRILFTASAAVLIATVRPYKEAYMNNLDTLVLSTMTLLSSFPLVYLFSLSNVDSTIGLVFVYFSIFVLSLPQIGLILYLIITFCHSTRPLVWLQGTFARLRLKKKRENVSTTNYALEGNVEETLPDRFLHPEMYYINAEDRF